MNQPEPITTQPGRYIQANGLNIYYEEYGAGDPLILLHGGTATISSWQGQIPAFAEHFRVIALDSRGHGKTDNPAGELSYSLMAHDVAAFIQALDLKNPLVFGYSDGGQIALEMGMRYPDLCNALVLGGTCYKFPPQYFEALKGFGFPEPGVFDFERMQREAPDWMEYLQSEHARADDPDYWKTLLRQNSRLWWSVQDYTLDDLKKITTPTLVLSGDRDEGVDVEQAVEMYRGIPNAELAILPNAAHGDLNETANSIVIDFLKGHAAQTESTVTS